MTSLEEFIKNEDLKNMPIYYYIDKVSGNKKPIGEKNNATVEEINKCKKERDVNYPKPEYKKEMINGKYEEIPFSVESYQNIIGDCYERFYERYEIIREKAA